MSYPKLIKRHTTDNHLVLSLDISPTLLDLAGAPIPSSVQGRSLLPLLKHEKSPWRDAFLIEYYTDTVFPRMLNMGYQAIRTDRWKYIHYVDIEGMDELYDLKADPYEMKNVFGNSNAQLILSGLKSKKENLLREIR
jgi:N-acetylglucosamine-6-sulfatase